MSTPHWKSLEQSSKFDGTGWNDLPNSIRAAESLPIFIRPSNSSTLYSNSILKKQQLISFSNLFVFYLCSFYLLYN